MMNLNESPFYSRSLALSTVLEDHKIYAVDVETYYTRDYNLSNGVDAYVNSPEFEMTVFAMFNEEEKYSGDPIDAPVEKLNGAVIFAHNAEFDQLACEKAIELGKLRPFKPALWVCTKHMSKYFGLPGDLLGSAYHLLGQEISKAKREEAKGWTKEECLADPGYIAYCQADASTCYWIGVNLMNRWPAFEERVSRLTRKFAMNGIGFDLDRSEKGQHALEHELVKLQSSIPWEGPSLSLKEFGKWCALNEMPVAPTTNAKDPRFFEWAGLYPDGGLVASQMSMIRKLRKMIATLKSLDLRVREDGRVSTPLNYWGAHTGRFSGGQGVNFQGLAKKELMGVNVMGFFRPDPGNCFIQFDFANIEPRVLLCLANDTATLDLIRQGMDIYEAHARRCNMYHGKEPLAKAEPELRQVCKARVLGLGYGCGPKTFKDVASALTGGKVKLTDKEAETIVKDYRRDNPLIVNYWRLLEEIARKKSGAVKIALPSGRLLRFNVVDHKAKALEVEYIKGRGTEKSWGAKLVENVTQAVARDILADCLVSMDEVGLKVLLHVHDSVIVECKESEANRVMQLIREVAEKPPEWMKDGEGNPIPLQVDISKCSNGLG